MSGSWGGANKRYSQMNRCPDHRRAGDVRVSFGSKCHCLRSMRAEKNRTLSVRLIEASQRIDCIGIGVDCAFYIITELERALLKQPHSGATSSGPGESSEKSAQLWDLQGGSLRRERRITSLNGIPFPPIGARSTSSHPGLDNRRVSCAHQSM